MKTLFFLPIQTVILLSTQYETSASEIWSRHTHQHIINIAVQNIIVSIVFARLTIRWRTYKKKNSERLQRVHIVHKQICYTAKIQQQQ